MIRKAVFEQFTDRYLPVGMGSRAELTDTLESITAEINQATRKLYSRFAEMTNDQMVEELSML